MEPDKTPLYNQPIELTEPSEGDLVRGYMVIALATNVHTGYESLLISCTPTIGAITAEGMLQQTIKLDTADLLAQVIDDDPS